MAEVLDVDRAGFLGAIVVARAVACAVMATLLLGCEMEERRIGYRPMLGGLPGAVGGYEMSPLVSADDAAAKLGDDQLETKAEDGSRLLLARTARHVMVHIYNTLSKDESELFVKEVLSEKTQQEYYEHGMDPSESFKTVKAREAEVKRLFDLMPMGEFTPGLFLRGVGGGVQRLEVTGKMAQGLTWTGIDVVLERGSYRLLWFVTPGR